MKGFEEEDDRRLARAAHKIACWGFRSRAARQMVRVAIQARDFAAMDVCHHAAERAYQKSHNEARYYVYESEHQRGRPSPFLV